MNPDAKSPAATAKDQPPAELSPIRQLAPFRFTHAKHDYAHCCIPGLFQTFRRGDRAKKKLQIKHRFKKYTLEFRNFEPLDATDLRVLQGLLALGAPLENPEILTETPQPDRQELRDSLKLSDSSRQLHAVVVEGSYYLLAKEIGHKDPNGKDFARIRDSIERLCGVTIIADYGNGVRHGYNLMGRYTSDERKKQITVVLNPRLSAAILGRRIVGGSGSHTRIEMAEVRVIRGDVTRILHQYLCAMVPPGEIRDLTAETLIGHIWPGKCTTKTRQKHYERLRTAMTEMVRIGWKCKLVAESRKDSVKKPYRKWYITRPAIIEIEGVPVAAAETITEPKESPPADEMPEEFVAWVKKSPARALREAVDRLSPEQFGDCIKKQPTAAIKHCLDRLTDDQFHHAAAKAPEAALRYALNRLSAGQFAACALNAPAAALKFALEKLPPSGFVAAAKVAGWPAAGTDVTAPQLDAWFEADPRTALHYTATRHAPEIPKTEILRSAAGWLAPRHYDICVRTFTQSALEQVAVSLTDDQLALCVLKNPTHAFKHAASRLDAQQIEFAARKSPWGALEWARDVLTREQTENAMLAMAHLSAAQLERLVQESPEAALRYAPNRLTAAQFDSCVRLAPQVALKYGGHRLTYRHREFCVNGIKFW